jgi:hypothetical protein
MRIVPPFRLVGASFSIQTGEVPETYRALNMLQFGYPIYLRSFPTVVSQWFIWHKNDD